MEEVLAKPPPGDLLLDVLVGCREDPDVHLHRLGGADPGHHALLKHPQHLGLRRGGHVAHLVEEEGAAVGQLELAGAVGEGAGEAALHVPEELALDELRGNRGAVHLDERAVPPGRRLVQGPGHQLLAAPVLAPDENAGVGGPDPGDEGPHLLERGAGPHHGVAGVERLLELPVLPRERGVLERVAEGDDEAVGVERLLEEIERAPLGRLHRGGYGAVPRDHDDGGRRLEVAEPRQGLQAVESGHLHVEQHDVGSKLGADGDPFPARGRGADLPALVLEHLAHRVADAALVVHHQHPVAHRGALRAGAP